jgi:hypothetical protein
MPTIKNDSGKKTAGGEEKNERISGKIMYERVCFTQTSIV